jgi:hypothetical protein
MGEIWRGTGKSKRNPKTIKIGLLRSEIKGMFPGDRREGEGEEIREV